MASPCLPQRSRPVVVIGEFDGFHVGHVQLVRSALELATTVGSPLVALALIAPSPSAPLLPVNERVARLIRSGAGAAFACELPDDRDDPTARAILRRSLERLDARLVAVACAPTDQAGDRSLSRVLESEGYVAVEVPRLVDEHGAYVTSELVRRLLRAGNVAAAARLLGRPYSLSEIVVRGNQLGRTIGFPTANLAAGSEFLPGNGVYAGSAVSGSGERHVACINVGVRPTVTAGGTVVVEAHLLDFDGDLYEKPLELQFHHRLREEQRFDSLDALTDQLHRDARSARDLMAPTRAGDADPTWTS